MAALQAYPAVPQQQVQYASGPPGAVQYMNVAMPATAAPGAAAMPQAWSSGLTDCCDDCYVCTVGCNLGACLYAENYRKIYNTGFCGACCLMWCCGWLACCFASSTRSSLRSKYNLPAEPCNDCCVHFFCSPCAVCQENRELRIREKWQTWN